MPYLYKEREYLNETDLRAAGFSRVAGIDEVGRGPGAAGLVVCCCMLSIDHDIEGLADSKRLSENKRNELAILIEERAISLSLTMAGPEEIDRINIFEAERNCVYAAVKNMVVQPDFVIIDGNFNFPNLIVPYLSVPGADGAQIYAEVEGKKKQIGHHYENVAAASIVAKVFRDKLMYDYDKMYPEYGFAKHKGYLTPDHLAALRKHGPCPIHRRSFRGVL